MGQEEKAGPNPEEPCGEVKEGCWGGGWEVVTGGL